MAGHNKWSKVKHIKARVDARKGKMFSKFAHEISIAARDGGGDPDMNPRLRTAVDNAKAQSMPKDNIDRAIKKGTGELGGEAIQEVVYEGYGPGGIAMMVEVATDNTNRSAAGIRAIFSKNGGSIATPGSVAYQFDRKGEIRIPAGAGLEDKVLEVALEAGAEDVQREDEEHVVYTGPGDLAAVAESIRATGMEVSLQQLVSVPQNVTVITDPAEARKAMRIYELLDDYDDTMNVFSNFEVTEEVLTAIND